MSRKRTGVAGVHRVADAELSGIDQPDDVAGVGDVDRLAVAAEEPVGARRANQLADAAVGAPSCPCVNSARADAHERDAIAMPRVHVRLDLEHEAGEAIVGRADDAGVAFARLRRRREIDQRAAGTVRDRSCSTRCRRTPASA